MSRNGCYPDKQKGIEDHSNKLSDEKDISCLKMTL